MQPSCPFLTQRVLSVQDDQGPYSAFPRPSEGGDLTPPATCEVQDRSPETFRDLSTGMQLQSLDVKQIRLTQKPQLPRILTLLSPASNPSILLKARQAG